MLSRVANSIYWMSRYIERAENVARFIHVNFNLLLDYPGFSDKRQWAPLVATSGDDQDFRSRYGEATEENVIQFLSFDTKNPNSIISCLYAARENGRAVRDALPTEIWEHLNNFYLMVRMRSREKEVWDIHNFYNEVKKASHLFIGISNATMCREEAWSFASVGRVVERADKTSRIIDVRNLISFPNVDDLNAPFDSIFLGALLKSASAFEMYQKHFQQIYYKNVVNFLIFDKTFPRSLCYCVEETQSVIAKITEDTEKTPMAVEEVNNLVKSISDTNIQDVFESGIHKFIDQFQLGLNRLGNEIHNSFFI